MLDGGLFTVLVWLGRPSAGSLLAGTFCTSDEAFEGGAKGGGGGGLSLL